MNIVRKLFYQIDKHRKIVFTIYFLIVIGILVFKLPTRMVIDNIIARYKGFKPMALEPQFVPFKTIRFYWANAQVLTDWFVKNLAVNIITFLPLGFLLSLKYNLMGKHFIRVFLYSTIIGFLFSVAIEVIQHLINIGRCDVDDIILNTIGAAMGALLYYLLALIFRFRENKDDSL